MPPGWSRRYFCCKRAAESSPHPGSRRSTTSGKSAFRHCATSDKIGRRCSDSLSHLSPVCPSRRRSFRHAAGGGCCCRTGQKLFPELCRLPGRCRWGSRLRQGAFWRLPDRTLSAYFSMLHRTLPLPAEWARWRGSPDRWRVLSLTADCKLR